MPERALVVEDDPVMLEACAEVLRQAAYEVIKATTGEAAQSIVRREPIDLAVVDLRMPSKIQALVDEQDPGTRRRRGQGRRGRRQRAHPGRERVRQGAGGPGRPRPRRPPREALRRHQLRRHPREPPGSFLEACRVRGDKEVSGISPEALELLAHYDWPGNVRELKNAGSGASPTPPGPW